MESSKEIDAQNRNRAESQSMVSVTEESAVGSFRESDGGEPAEEEEVPRWFPRCCGKPILHGNPEALGWLLSMSGQTCGILGVGAFVIPSLVYFAKLEAGCEVEIPEGETELPECNERVYGLRPSSMVTTVTGTLSLLVALLTPLMGAIIDYTHHRRRIGRVLAFLYVVLLFPLLFIAEDTWFPLMICVLVCALVAQTLTLVVHAYLPDLTDSEEVLNDLTKTFIAFPGVNSMTFIIVVMATSIALGYGGEEGPTARIAAVFGVVLLSVYFFAAWGFLMKPRPVLNTLGEGQWLLTQGFKQIFRTMTKLYRSNIPLLWFYAAVALGDVKPLTGIGLTYLSSQQQFSSMDIGIAAMVMLVSVVPGAIVSSFMCRRFNPVLSSVMSVIAMIVITAASSIFLTGANQKAQTYVMVACWGIGGGWKVTSTAMLVAAIVPEGQDAELMGFYLFSDTCLSWLPPLIFTAMNEAGLSERVGLFSSIIIFWVLALFAYWKMGNYEDRVRAAGRLAVAPVENTALKTIAEDPKMASDETPADAEPEQRDTATKVYLDAIAAGRFDISSNNITIDQA